MAYFLEGVGDEFLFIIIAYFVLVFLLIRYLKLPSCIELRERAMDLWQNVRITLLRGYVSSLDSSTDNPTNEDDGLDIRIFNKECCVCFNEDCTCPVTTACGHCFCGLCAINLIKHCSVPMKCPLCRQECRILHTPTCNEENMTNNLRSLVFSSVTSYNNRAEHRFPFVNRVRSVPVMFQHLIRSFGALREHLIFRLKCHVIAAVIVAVCYVALSTDILPEGVFGPIGFLDDILVLIFLSVLVARTYTSIDSSVTFEDIRAALE